MVFVIERRTREKIKKIMTRRQFLLNLSWKGNKVGIEELPGNLKHTEIDYGG